MELATLTQLKRRLGGYTFDARAFGLAYISLEERGYTDGQIYRLALGGDGEITHAEWIDRVARARQALPFAALKVGDSIKAGGRKFTVAEVNHQDSIVDLRTKGGGRLSLMPHGAEPIKYVIASNTTARVVDSWTRL